jgi:hypothetical protein
MSQNRPQNMISKILNNLVQEFVQPPSHYSFTVRAQWTPTVCVMMKRANNNNLEHKSIPLEKRVATF